jgi:hypothetical protein
MEKKKYGIQIHECREDFDIDKLVIIPTRHKYMCKPSKALWTSTKIEEDNNGNPITDWSNWCEANDFSIGGSSPRLYEIVPSDNAKILTISAQDMVVNDIHGNVIAKQEEIIDNIIERNPSRAMASLNGNRIINYNKASNLGIDIVNVEESAIAAWYWCMYRTDSKTPYQEFLLQFYGWDAESSVWLNKNAIKDVIKI